jgi:hypothetical protein
MTCPYCDVALRVADDVPAAWVTCPNCLGRIPNPAAAAAGGGSVMASLVDAEVRGDSRNTGCGVLVMVALITAGIGFAASFGLSVSRKAGRYGDNLFIVWFLVGGGGGLVALALTTTYMTRLLSRRLGEDDQTSPAAQQATKIVIVFLALLIGAGAALVVFGLTCGAILGGMGVGGG